MLSKPSHVPRQLTDRIITRLILLQLNNNQLFRRSILSQNRNPADQVEVKRPDDQRDRYLSEDELRRLKVALDEKIYRKGTKEFNKTFCRLRMIVLIAVTTGMRMSEIFGLLWSDAMYNEGLLAVRA